MAETVKDGTGSGYLVKVDEHNRIHALSKSEGFGESLSKQGNSYNLNTGAIRLSGSSTISQLLYLKNNGDSNIIINGITYLIGPSTGGTGSVLVSIYRNPISGTLITSGTVKTPVNNNFGSSNILDVTSLIGGDGFTITNSDGIAYESLLVGSGMSYRINPDVIVIPKGASIGIGAKTQVGNTGMDIQIAINCYLDI